MDLIEAMLPVRGPLTGIRMGPARVRPACSRLALAVVALAVSALVLESPASRVTLADQPPNILLIVSEDNGPELGCYGDRFAVTPNLDGLARQGMRFETAYVTQSVCSPSRSTIFTGLYPHQNGQIGLATHNYGMFREYKFCYLLNLSMENKFR